ncbi:hypothetical protein JTB14_024690 [Gonioctena quinquepunctata]|nr:hypothetical protein JTB14_024690 [Gonioctena quinquepunctata]
MTHSAPELRFSPNTHMSIVSEMYPLELDFELADTTTNDLTAELLDAMHEADEILDRPIPRYPQAHQLRSRVSSGHRGGQPPDNQGRREYQVRFPDTSLLFGTSGGKSLPHPVLD